MPIINRRQGSKLDAPRNLVGNGATVPVARQLAAAPLHASPRAAKRAQPRSRSLEVAASGESARGREAGCQGRSLFGLFCFKRSSSSPQCIAKRSESTIARSARNAPSLHTEPVYLIIKGLMQDSDRLSASNKANVYVFAYHSQKFPM